MKGKLVVIEGIDGSGKRTQWRRLVKKLGAVGVDFPRYNQSGPGRLLKDLLAGKHGDFQQTTPYLAVLPYVVDQYLWWREEGRKQIANGKWLIANRYVTSNVHQIYKLTGKAREKFAAWFWRMVYQELGLPKPDLVMWLDVPPEVSNKLISDKYKDKSEVDREYQAAAYKGYKEMCKQHKNWVRVECMENGRLLTKEKISERMGKIWHEKFKAS
jgi:dTMP kinase